MAARKIRAKAQKIAAHLLEVGEGDLEWEVDRFKVKGNPSAGEDDEGDRHGGAHEQPAATAWRRGWTRRSTTTRPT